jgi:hypothetical protein
MPSFRKLSAAETAALERSPLAERAAQMLAYDALLADFAPGDYGQVELGDEDSRMAVLRRLHAAADRRGWRLAFNPGPTLIFCVEAAG